MRPNKIDETLALPTPTHNPRPEHPEVGVVTRGQRWSEPSTIDVPLAWSTRTQASPG